MLFESPFFSPVALFSALLAFDPAAGDEVELLVVVVELLASLLIAGLAVAREVDGDEVVELPEAGLDAGDDDRVAEPAVGLGEDFGDAVAVALAAGDVAERGLALGVTVPIGVGDGLAVAATEADGELTGEMRGLAVATGLGDAIGEAVARVCAATPVRVPVAPTPSVALMPMLGCTP